MKVILNEKEKIFIFIFLMILEVVYVAEWLLVFVSFFAYVTVGRSKSDVTKSWLEFHRHHPVGGIILFVVMIAIGFIILWMNKKGLEKK